ncbi:MULTISPECIES: tRNA-(ms[2]io[6]A)-hydroxylase [unclassified Synechococcus]|uniref:tRNA-(ms[2]io[6]A)-hydroxylase n=1 Tax=unclassified Synechococcus TaxID=2626047 RepID=UPI002AD560A9|nr:MULTISPECIES: tRNA-(ms[2]io[6]A)-hydroxylase [unclassified Synechococcus]MEA5424529.1 tRNA-(ms[2]io[6]A)-hydroxylase [Synechococcus sp. CCY9202]CAK6697510.1 hypothetical protein IFHNHDMJ_02243 [Synechococcus sp. CBW1107]
MTVTAASEFTRVKWLARPSSESWLEKALSHPDLLLIDHAHCERKAAGAALQLMFRYPSDTELAAVLSPLIQEELQHFDRVLALLQRRGISLRALPAPPYGASLAQEIRRQEPERMLDSFLVAGLIEARSHERMGLLASHTPDPELCELYSDLLASEARHFGLYWLLSEQRFGRPLTVARLEQLADRETQILSGTPASSIEIRFHSAGIQEDFKPCQAPQATGQVDTNWQLPT